MTAPTVRDGRKAAPTIGRLEWFFIFSEVYMDEVVNSCGGLYNIKTVKVGNNTYVGLAKPDVTSTSTPKWRVFRVTDDGNGNITKSFANGKVGFCHPANDMPSLSYPEL